MSKAFYSYNNEGFYTDTLQAYPSPSRVNSNNEWKQGYPLNDGMDYMLPVVTGTFTKVPEARDNILYIINNKNNLFSMWNEVVISDNIHKYNLCAKRYYQDALKEQSNKKYDISLIDNGFSIIHTEGMNIVTQKNIAKIQVGAMSYITSVDKNKESYFVIDTQVKMDSICIIPLISYIDNNQIEIYAIRDDINIPLKAENKGGVLSFAGDTKYIRGKNNRYRYKTINGKKKKVEYKGNILIKIIFKPNKLYPVLTNLLVGENK